MLDPVTTPCGITYEKASLREHLAQLRAKGKEGFDPVSRKPLQLEQVPPSRTAQPALPNPERLPLLVGVCPLAGGPQPGAARSDRGVFAGPSVGV